MGGVDNGQKAELTTTQEIEESGGTCRSETTQTLSIPFPFIGDGERAPSDRGRRGGRSQVR
jgi:hypothetical protein